MAEVIGVAAAPRAAPLLLTEKLLHHYSCSSRSVSGLESLAETLLQLCPFVQEVIRSGSAVK